MSGDALCVGVCMIDWEEGVCLGCGRSTDEIHGVAGEPSPAAPTVADKQGAAMPPKAAAQDRNSGGREA